MLRRIRFLVQLARAHGTARRYFATNGFDGALTVLGLMLGIHLSERADPAVALSAGLGTAVALGVSGISSAYISESAEQRRRLQELEGAMMADLAESAHGRSARVIPVVIALVNGLAPFLIAVVIMVPLWLSSWTNWTLFDPLVLSMMIALACVFGIGVFLGRLSGSYWLWGGIRALLVAMVTSLLIILLEP